MKLRLSASALAMGIVLAPAAFALTPEEVWNGWTGYYKSMGYTVTEGSRDLAGETLTVKDVAFASGGAEGAKVSFTVPQVVLQAAGDGSVRTTTSESFPVKIESTDADQKVTIIDMTVSAPGMEVMTSGDGTARSDKTTGSKLTVNFDKVDQPDDLPDMMNVGSVTLTDLSTDTATDDGKTYRSTGKVGQLGFAIDVNQPDGKFKGGGTVDAVDFSGTVTLPEGEGVKSGDIVASLDAGLAMQGMMKAGNTDSSFEFSTPESGDQVASNGTATGKSQGGDLTFAMTKAGLTYQGSAQGLDASATDSSMPAPIAYKVDTAAFDFQMPLERSDTPAPFKIAYSLTGLTMADSVWNLFDSGNKLPRAPANIDIDVSGLAKVNANLLDPTATAAQAPADPTTPTTGTDPAATDPAAAEQPMPFNPTEISINKFSIDAVGAKIAADGMLKVPEGGTMQAPVGTINAHMEGVNGLIDALTAAGLVQSDQVQGFRMMLAMFAKPGDGPDTLNSAIEFREDGSILANGQQIK